MGNPIDYDWQDEKLHKSRILLGDPLAQSVDVLMQYAERINQLNEGVTNYTIAHLVQVMNQSRNIPASGRIALGCLSSKAITDYWPTLEENEALLKITKVQPAVTRREMFTEIDRGSGRTVRKAHELMGVLLTNPGKWVVVEDHYDTPKSNLELAKMIIQLLSSIGISLTIQDFVDPNSLGRSYKVQISPINKPKVLK